MGGISAIYRGANLNFLDIIVWLCIFSCFLFLISQTWDNLFLDIQYYVNIPQVYVVPFTTMPASIPPNTG